METTIEKKNVIRTNGYIYSAIFFLATIALEIVNFVTLGIGVLPINLGVELAVIVVIAGIILICPTEWLKILVSTLFVGFQFVINIINSCVYKNLYNITTIDMIFARGGETGAVFELDMIHLPSLIVSLVIIGLYITAIVLGSKHAPKVEVKRNSRSLFVFAVFMIAFEGICISAYNVCDNAYATEMSSTYAFENGAYMYGSNAVKFANMQKYGFYGYYLKSLEQFFGYDRPISASDKKALKEFVEDGKDYEYSNSQFNGTNVSGSLAGDNLIVIMIESGEWFGIDPYNTPTLYDFMHNQALAYTSYYSRNPTNFSEDISLVGNTPNDYALSEIAKKTGINTPTSLPNLFKGAGYESVKFYHDYLGTFYDRKVVNVALGFDEVFTLEDSTLEDKSEKFGDFVDDGAFIKSCEEDFMPSDKSFFSFYTTVSMHGPYTRRNERFNSYYETVDANYDRFCQYAKDENLGYNIPKKDSKEWLILREYKAKTMALDNMMSVILERLENTTDTNGEKLIDTTTIVMFADHNAYYQDLSYKIAGVGETDTTKKAYNVPFVIYNKKLGSGEQTVFCNTYDIFPTLCDLYGFKFNRNLAQGHSVFSDDIGNSVFLSSMASIFDKNYYSLTMQNIVKDTSENVGTADVVSFKKKVSNFLIKQQKIENYYRVNYEDNFA